MDQSKPDWDISSLYSRAFEIIKKNKVLWILGAAAATGSSYNFNSSNFDSERFGKLFSPDHQNVPETVGKLSQVLGTSTAKPFNDALMNIFGSVSPQIYFLGALELLFLVILGLGITIVYHAWSQGLLIVGTDLAIKNNKITIADAAKPLLPRLKSLVWLFVVPGLVFVLAVFIAVFVSLIAVILIPFPLKLLPILIFIVVIGAMIYWSIMFAASMVWAPRELVLNSKAGKEALFSGYKIAKRKFWATLLLGIVNNILVAIIFIVPIVIVGAIIVGLVFAGVKNPSTLVPLVIAAILIAVPTIFGLIVLTGIVTGFKATVWTEAYSKIKGKYGD